MSVHSARPDVAAKLSAAQQLLIIAWWSYFTFHTYPYIRQHIRGQHLNSQEQGDLLLHSVCCLCRISFKGYSSVCVLWHVFALQWQTPLEFRVPCGSYSCYSLLRNHSGGRHFCTFRSRLRQSLRQNPTRHLCHVVAAMLLDPSSMRLQTPTRSGAVCPSDFGNCPYFMCL